MAFVLSSSTAIPAPKSANTFLGLVTPQIAVAESTFLLRTFRPDDLADQTLEKFEELRSRPIPLVAEEPAA